MAQYRMQSTHLCRSAAPASMFGPWESTDNPASGSSSSSGLLVVRARNLKLWTHIYSGPCILKSPIQSEKCATLKGVEI